MNSSKQRLKICYIIDNLSFRGGERVFAQLATGLDPAQYDVTVACSPGGPFVEFLEAANIRVVPFNMRPQFNPIALIRLTAFLRQEQFDIIHCQGRGDPYGRVAATLAGAPLIISTAAAIVSRYWVSSRLRKLMYWLIDRVTDRMVDHWLVLNQLSVEVLCQDHHISPTKISIIPNGIEVERYDPYLSGSAGQQINPLRIRQELKLERDVPLIGAVGRLAWEKGFSYLLDAMPAVLATHPEAHLLIAGNGELETELKEQAQRLGIAHRCHFLGFRKDIPDILAALDLFVLSSLIEGMPMVMLEAMAASKPIVATKIPGAVDVLEDGVDGLLVGKEDAQALASAINQLLADHSQAQRLGEAARRKALGEYTVERMVERTRQLYHDLLQEDKK